MSIPTPLPPSPHSDPGDSQDTTSSECSNSGISKYAPIELSEKNGCQTNEQVSSHEMEDILSESVNYNVNENVFAASKPEVLSSIPKSFMQDYNSRDSIGFSIQDILGLHHSYNVATSQDNLEPRYEYQMPDYVNISSNSNNYDSGTEEGVTEDCIDYRNNIICTTATHIENQVTYTKSYTANKFVRYHEKSGLCSDVAKDSEREINDVHDSNFPIQVIATEIFA